MLHPIFPIIKYTSRNGNTNQTEGDQNWTERSNCDQRSNLGRPLFLVLIFAAVTKIPEGVVVGFQNFAWAPK